MATKEPIKRKIISAIDWFVIERVRELRKSKFSQSELSREIGFSDGFIGRVENPNQSAIYNLRHLNLIAKALNINTVDLFPKYRLDEDLVEITFKMKPPTKSRTGEINYEVLEIVTLTPEQIVEYHRSVLNRPSRSGVPPRLKKRNSSKKS